jgi:N-glycosylase/DNA lyase
MQPTKFRRFQVPEYNLMMTLNSGQAFRWHASGLGWEGVIRGRWVHLEQHEQEMHCRTAAPLLDWFWLTDYLQLDIDIASITGTFPKDPPMRAALEACRGLRLLKQEPWEVLASYILSSTKQIVQIKQVVTSLCRCFGEPVEVPQGHSGAFAFPSPAALAGASEADLRRCKMGFRAPYLHAAAKAVASGELDLSELERIPVDKARERLEALPGVGPKVANCVLLSAYNCPTAFPLDVWILRALKELYFSRRRPSLKRLREFSETHFGPWSGYAQLYLFHYQRAVLGRKNSRNTKTKACPETP